LPVIGWKGRNTRVIKLEARVVLFQPDRVKAKDFAVNAIKSDSGAALDDQIVGNHVIGLRDQKWMMVLIFGYCIAGRNA
jgi:hypothetical protein